MKDTDANVSNYDKRTERKHFEQIYDLNLYIRDHNKKEAKWLATSY